MRRLRRAAVLLLAAAAACSGPGDGRPPAPAPTAAERRPPVTASIEVRSPVRFAVIGDFGTGGPEARAVADAIRSRARDLDLLVTTGDNVYDRGHPEAFDRAWERPYGWIERRDIPVIASLGNHDVQTAGGAPVMRLLDMPAPFYARRAGPVAFFVLDSTRALDPEQADFLAASLRRSSAPWKVAVFHHPPYTCSRPPTLAVRALWVPLLRAGGVDLVLAGHEHNYQRFPTIRDVTFVVTGGGGASLRPVDECPQGTPSPVAAVDDVHHFLLGEATSRRLTIEMVAVPDGPGDRLTLRR